MLPRPPLLFAFAFVRSAVCAVCVVCVVCAVFVGCSGSLDATPGALAQAPLADVATPVAGVVDRGSDPAVVAVESAGAVVCAGALVAPDVVLTARHCVIDGGIDPFVRLGEPGAGAPRSAVRSVAAPPGADAPDIALLLLDTPFDGVVPLAVRSTGVALGDHVRTVTFDAPAPGGGVVERVRDHVPVVAESATEVVLREVPCTAGCGGPAIDEATASIVGVLSRPGSTSAAVVGDVAARSDVVLSFVASVLAQAAAPVASGHPLRTNKGAVDFGATCGSAIDCAAGVCVSDGPRRYCSRSCAAADRCPARSRCVLCQIQTPGAAGQTGPPGDTGGAFDACVES